MILLKSLVDYIAKDETGIENFIVAFNDETGILRTEVVTSKKEKDKMIAMLKADGIKAIAIPYDQGLYNRIMCL
jgi:spermidine/putrescine-binding protein